MHGDAKSLRERGDRLFAAKQSLDSLNHEIALNFHPMRADFTSPHTMGQEFADHLTTGYPVQVRRELGDAIGAMLRPRNLPWFAGTTDDEDSLDHAGRLYLEMTDKRMRKAFADRRSMFTRATKEADHDFASFGQCVISTEVNRRDMTMLYRTWHLRDVAWAEDAYGQIAEHHINWKPTCAQLCSFFPKSVHPRVAERAKSEPNATVNVRWIVLRSDIYDAETRTGHPWCSVYLDCDNNHLLEEKGSRTKVFTVPRWATVSGSQYAYSPATVVGLPDSRLLQAMTLTLLDAGERAVNPPLVGVGEAIRGDLNIFPGGFTAVDAQYDERLGEVLRPLTTDSRALPFGVEMADRTAQALREAFYLNTLSLPAAQTSGDMTAFEVGQRVQEYIRQAMPLFEPIEVEYNGDICEQTFETMMANGAFGPASDIPDSLRGREVTWKFQSPLAEMIERHKGQTFLESKAIIAAAMELDPSAPLIMDAKATLRDVLAGIGSPQKWLRSEADVEAEMQRLADEQAMATSLAAAQQGADVAATLGQAAQSFAPMAA
jgi:hypothetical protein